MELNMNKIAYDPSKAENHSFINNNYFYQRESDILK
jgi:hypothetical protein